MGLAAAGCGSNTVVPGDGGAEASGGAAIPPAASIGAGKPSVRSEGALDGLAFAEGEEFAGDELEAAEPEEGTADWYVREIVRLPAPRSENIDELRRLRKEHCDKVIELAGKAIAEAHADKNREQVFNAAVNHLLEARLQLALQGDSEAVDALYDDAEALWKRDSESKAAADAAFTVVQLAYLNAKRTAPQDLRWLKEFTRQASNFAVNFPKEARRAPPLLFSAARSCELNDQLDEALDAYVLLRRTFPQSPQAEPVPGIIRRLTLAGQTPTLEGPTLDGGKASLADYRGKTVLVVFWRSEARPFLAELPELLALYEAEREHGLDVLGICLDDDPDSARAFVATKKLPWKNIYFDDPKLRGWKNPIAVHYGILDVKTWLIDSDGVVQSIALRPSQYQEAVTPLLKRGARRT